MPRGHDALRGHRLVSMLLCLLACLRIVPGRCFAALRLMACRGPSYPAAPPVSLWRPSCHQGRRRCACCLVRNSALSGCYLAPASLPRAVLPLLPLAPPRFLPPLFWSCSACAPTPVSFLSTAHRARRLLRCSALCGLRGVSCGLGFSPPCHAARCARCFAWSLSAVAHSVGCSGGPFLLCPAGLVFPRFGLFPRCRCLALSGLFCLRRPATLRFVALWRSSPRDPSTRCGPPTESPTPVTSLC